MSTCPPNFTPALVIVDLQEDFCPPSGSLAVPGARATVPHINGLLALPFRVKLATQDWHPPSHVSFARNHAGAAPFTGTAVVAHPARADVSYATTLWPVHCVAGTPGAALVGALHTRLLSADGLVRKGQDARVEMYSAFVDPFRWTPAGAVCESVLEARLRAEGVTDVYVVGLATDYCVKATAVDAVRLGFRVWAVRDACRAVGGEEGTRGAEAEMQEAGVGVVGIDGDEVGWVRGLEA